MDSPLIESGNNNNNNNSNVARRIATLQGAARYIQRVSSRRMMREPSIMVRETATQQLEERQIDWAHSKPVVILDLFWNLAFVVASLVILLTTFHEQPSTPLRVWICGYALQCILHMIYVFYEYRKRSRSRLSRSAGGSEGLEVSGAGRQVDSQAEEGRDEPEEESSSFIKRLESINTVFSFFWWLVGLYWVVSGGNSLPDDAPRLYWLCVAFLAFDVFFVVFCVALACVIGIGVCCCLPCIIAILYAVADQTAASEADISLIPRYRFCRVGPSEKDGEKSRLYGGIMTSTAGETSSDKVLDPEDAECCICLSPYEDGVELHELPCNHHFHCACIEKWLRINATCPLCKYNILKNNDGREV